MKIKKKWTSSEKKLLIKIFASTPTKEIAKTLKRSENSISGMANILRLKKSKEYLEKLRFDSMNLIVQSGEKYRFQKGHEPFNKGEKLTAEHREKVISKGFQKGQKPKNTMPDFTEVSHKKDEKRNIVKIKIPEIGFVSKAKHNWEQVHGILPSGYNLIHIDGDYNNCEVANLECISDQELMKKNTIHRYPAELKKTIKTLSKLNKIIKTKN